MWVCQTCGRIFEKTKQPHSCHTIPFEQHFKNKEKARILFDALYKEIAKKIGICEIISLSCCVHLFGQYDFLAALPLKDRLELHFVLYRKLDSSRVIKSVSTSSKAIMNSVYLFKIEDIDKELLDWLREAYHLKEKELLFVSPD